MHYTYPIELFAEVRPRGADCIVRILAACAVPPQQRPEAKNPQAALKR